MGGIENDINEAECLMETQCGWLREIGFIHVDCYLKHFELAVFAGVKPN